MQPKIFQPAASLGARDISRQEYRGGLNERVASPETDPETLLPVTGEYIYRFPEAERYQSSW